MQNLTSKTSLLTIVIFLGLALVYLWFRYSAGLAALLHQRSIWEYRYDSLLHQFEKYSAEVSFTFIVIGITLLKQHHITHESQNMTICYREMGNCENSLFCKVRIWSFVLFFVELLGQEKSK